MTKEEIIRPENLVCALLAALPEEFLGFPVRMAGDLRMGRVGPLQVEGFYRKFGFVTREELGLGAGMILKKRLKSK